MQKPMSTSGSRSVSEIGSISSPDCSAKWAVRCGRMQTIAHVNVALSRLSEEQFPLVETQHPLRRDAKIGFP